MRAPVCVLIEAKALAARLECLFEGLEAGLLRRVVLIGGAPEDQSLARAAGLDLAQSRAEVAHDAPFTLDLGSGATLAQGWATIALAAVARGEATALPILAGQARLERTVPDQRAR